MKKRGILIFSLLFVIAIAVIYLIVNNSYNECNDGTLYNQCSGIQPYYCFMGNLIERAPLCGCANLSEVQGNKCVAPYSSERKTVSLNYTLRGQKGTIDFAVYKGLYDYLSAIPRYYNFEENHTLLDFRMKMLDDEYQRELLLPLVIEIQKITSDKEDQAKIAISLVQNIPFGNSDKILKVGGIVFDYQRYPYEVLYDTEGVCGEKSELLVFLLRELNYSSAFLYYSAENHEAVGIKCPKKYGVDDSEYCFVETTGPSIISDDKTEYVGIVSLTSDPLILIASEGLSLNKYEQEYLDAQILENIRESARDDGLLNPIQYLQYQTLKTRYGLEFFS